MFQKVAQTVQTCVRKLPEAVWKCHAVSEYFGFASESFGIASEGFRHASDSVIKVSGSFRHGIKRFGSGSDSFRHVLETAKCFRMVSERRWAGCFR